MYQHVLIAVAFGAEQDPEKSFQAAKALADDGARVTLLHVKEEIPSFVVNYIPDGLTASLKAEIQEQLDGYAKRFGNGTGVLIDGHAGRSILEWAEAHGVDCIVVASHRPGLQDYFLGSTAGQVVRHAPCSVHVVR